MSVRGNVEKPLTLLKRLFVITKGCFAIQLPTVNAWLPSNDYNLKPIKPSVIGSHSAQAEGGSGSFCDLLTGGAGLFPVS